jgi:hypothetical protein
MKRFIRGAAVAVAIIAPAVMSIAPSASAASADVFAQIGGGTITPGLNVTPAPQTFNFSGSGPAVGTDAVPTGTATCTATGNDAVGTIAVGEGNATITCTIGSRTVTVVATFVRVGAAVLVVSANASVQLGTGVCLFVTTDTPPVKSYTLVCGAAYVSSN